MSYDGSMYCVCVWCVCVCMCVVDTCLQAHKRFMFRLMIWLLKVDRCVLWSCAAKGGG